MTDDGHSKDARMLAEVTIIVNRSRPRALYIAGSVLLGLLATGLGLGLGRLLVR